MERYVRDSRMPEIIRQVNVKTEDIIRTDDIMRDIFYTLQKTEGGDFLIRCVGNVAPYRIGESWRKISGEEAEQIKKSKDAWEEMNFIASP